MNDPSGLFFTIVMFVAIFYFLIYRPQQKHRRQRQELMDSLAVGKKIITIGGIHGEVVAMRDDTITLKISENTEIVAQKTAVAIIQEEDIEDEEDDEEAMEEQLDDGNLAQDEEEK